MAEPVKIFYSYAHEDEPLRIELEKHLFILQRQEVISGWHDRKIGAGQEWADEIDTHLETAQAILLLVSPDFMASDYCWGVEVKKAMERHEAGDARVIPIILRPVYWKGSPFAKLQALPTDVKPVTSWTDRDAAFVSVVRGVQAAIEELTGAEAEVEPEEVVEAAVTVPEEESPSLDRQAFEPEMVLVPEGEFLMGSDPQVDEAARDNEQPQHTLFLPDYHIAKTPVTNAQYAAFVRSTGHDPPEHWEDGKPPRDKDNHPVVNVSWHDALAYCNWLSEVTGKPYQLPSEAEWEKAARGMDGRIYPWGNQWDEERCNTWESGIDDTTPVGAYPEGASPYGVLDMVGNAWEWTRSLWGKDVSMPEFKYPYDPADGREDLQAPDNVHRVLRGGSFIGDQYFARVAFRIRNSPLNRYPYRGFRVGCGGGGSFL